MSDQSLFYRELGNGRPIVILHGVFGSSDNWMTIARALSEQFKLYVLDQRNHGQSFHSDDFNYRVMVEDLKKFLDDHQIKDPFIIAHSMGGKVAMNFAVKYPDYLEKLVVVDISPRSYRIHHDQILEGLSSIELEKLESRKDADQQLAKYVPETSIRNFLLKNLARDDEGSFTWRINLPIIRMKIERVGMGLMDEGQFTKPTLFIKGGSSDYIQEIDNDLIAASFPLSEIKTIEGAGHWVHAEKPEEFLSMVQEFLT